MRLCQLARVLHTGLGVCVPIFMKVGPFECCKHRAMPYPRGKTWELCDLYGHNILPYFLGPEIALLWLLRNLSSEIQHVHQPLALFALKCLRLRIGGGSHSKRKTVTGLNLNEPRCCMQIQLTVTQSVW
jgi:hypothetical protein